jgi:voltage-gated potassium channel Kch
MNDDHSFNILISTVILTLLIGTLFYNYVEGWSVLDSVYFSVITLTTVGYGDLVPITDAGKIFTMFYVFLGIGIIFAFIRASTARRINRKK